MPLTIDTSSSLPSSQLATNPCDIVVTSISTSSLLSKALGVYWPIQTYKLLQHLENSITVCEMDEQSILILDENDNLQYDDVYNDPNWIKAMQSKYDSITWNETWELMPLLLGKQTITTCWVFKLKPSSHDLPPWHKAWLVAHGCHQKQEVDCYETFVHVVN